LGGPNEGDRGAGEGALLGGRVGGAARSSGESGTGRLSAIFGVSSSGIGDSINEVDMDAALSSSGEALRKSIVSSECGVCSLILVADSSDSIGVCPASLVTRESASCSDSVGVMSDVSPV
jgi:hypothetical protein